VTELDPTTAGIVMAVIAVLALALKIISKLATKTNERRTPMVVDLPEGLKTALYDGSRASIENRNWHAPVAGEQTWLGGRIQEEQVRTNVKLDEVVIELKNVVKAINGGVK